MCDRVELSCGVGDGAVAFFVVEGAVECGFAAAGGAGVAVAQFGECACAGWSECEVAAGE